MENSSLQLSAFGAQLLRYNKNYKAFLRRSSLLLAVYCLLFACTPKEDPPLPIFGEREVIGTDTTYHTIADFKFVDQDSVEVTNETYKDKIYVTDFFFTSCRTICPIMKTQMLRVYDSVKNDPEVLLLSHTIDPEYDTVGLLHDFADRLVVNRIPCG